MGNIRKLVVDIPQPRDRPLRLYLEGRRAWALDQLLRAGEGGCTPITHPGPRWSDYVFKLRGDGIDIETVTEAHGGTYSGHHARYVLKTPVTVVEEVRV